MFATAAEPKRIAWFAELAHNNYARWRPDRYRETVVGFLRRHLADD